MNDKSNGKSKIALCFSVVLGGLIMITSASAQQAMTNSPSFEQQSNAPALQAPKSNRLVLSMVAGKVRVLDSKGLLLESNTVYLPRVQISDLSDSDLHALLETKTAYAALTTFGPINERTAQSAVIENQLRQVWLQGKSLGERIQTRLLLLDDMRAYNADIAWLPGLMVKADNDAARASMANDRMAASDQAAAGAADGVQSAEDDRAMGDASHQEVHDARSEYKEANERAAREDNRAAADNYRSAVANQSVQNYLDACAAISGDLAAHGIHVPWTPPFYRLPPLSMKPEVDAERTAGGSAAVSSTTATGP